MKFVMKNNVFLVLLLLLTSIALTVCSCKSTIKTKNKDSVSILFVGSSHMFVGDVPGQLKMIAKEYGVEISYIDISRHGNRGGTLRELRENAINEIQEKIFDYVVLQDQTIRSFNDVEGLLNEISILSKAARQNGAIPVLYNFPWAVINRQPDVERLKITTEVFKRAAIENDAIFVNAADAWIYAYQTIPGISLYTRFDPRGMHANNAGAFLTACVFAGILFDLHIKDIVKNNRYRGRDAIAIGQVAWDFVQNFKNK